MVLNAAPLELAGRVALNGRLLFDDDPVARVVWVASTRKVYADEQYRLLRSEREFAESVRHGRSDPGAPAAPLGDAQHVCASQGCRPNEQC